MLVKDAQGAIGPSFRDATRVAGANPPLWRDIYLANRQELSRAIGAVRAYVHLLSDEALTFERWAVVIDVWPPPTRPASITTTASGKLSIASCVVCWIRASRS